MVCLAKDGRGIRPALLWNDTRSADAADALVRELGNGDRALGDRRWVEAVGTVPVAALTVAKLRWLADQEPGNASRIAAVALPHDWLTWRLRGTGSLDDLVTDRSDASGTGYFDAVSGTYRRDLLALALRRPEEDVRPLVLPRVHGPCEQAGMGDSRLGLSHTVIGPGCGDNAGAALGLGLDVGRVFLSLGTSGVVAAVSEHRSADPTGSVAGFADATGKFLPLACTLNATRVLDTMAAVLGVNHDEFDALALSAAPGASGMVHVAYLQGERTPNLPHATGVLDGMTLSSMTRENFARAAVEGLLCLMADALEAVREQDVSIEHITLVGGGARSAAVREIAPSVLGVSVHVPQPGEYVTDGAARQAAWILSGGHRPPTWPLSDIGTYTAQRNSGVLARYRRVAAEVARS